jgi:hypothetical protein
LPLEDFTTYTETDVPANHIQFTANHIDHKGYRNEDTRMHKDKGANHFGDFTHLINVKPIAYGTTSYGISCVWMLSVDTADDEYGLKTANKTAMSVDLHGYAYGSNTYLALVELYAGTRYVTANIFLTVGTQYYLKIVKSGTSLTLNVYTDAARTIHATGSPVSLTLQADHKCQYIFAGNTYNDGTDTNKWVDVDIDDLDLQEGAPPIEKKIMVDGFVCFVS